MQLLYLVFGKRKAHPFSLLVFIALISVLGCLGVNVLPYPCSSLSYPIIGFSPLPRPLKSKSIWSPLILFSVSRPFVQVFVRIYIFFLQSWLVFYPLILPIIFWPKIRFFRFYKMHGFVSAPSHSEINNENIMSLLI